MYNEIRMRFISKRGNIAIIRNAVSAFIIDSNPTITFLNELKTVISEAITNCIVHGYDNKEDQYVEMNVFVDDVKVACDIIDYGKGIEDIALAREPLYSTKKEEERSGLGFTIMEMFCDTFEVESKVGEGTKLHFSKNW
ncbi:MAG: anti-sigma F factor [Acholeplasmatales bacterium]|jgi:stage II sporulation protein AB (anti-sigma F factor)|nr:anti-sigma F factor [Acholeplasmatales bacterium]MCI9653682.1 anti-sigma F factor [Acholeplasmatales bacterium]